MGSLLREQLRRRSGDLATLVLTVGLLPLLFHLAPGLATCDCSACRWPGCCWAWLVYPFLVLLGWRYVRRAERNERDFADLRGRRGPVSPASTPPPASSRSRW